MRGLGVVEARVEEWVWWCRRVREFYGAWDIGFPRRTVKGHWQRSVKRQKIYSNVNKINPSRHSAQQTLNRSNSPKQDKTDAEHSPYRSGSSDPRGTHLSGRLWHLTPLGGSEATSSAHGTKGTFVVYQKSIPARHRRQYPGAHSAVPPSLGDNARSHRPPPGKPTPILALGIIRGEGAWVSYLLESLCHTFLTDLYEKGQKFRTYIQII